MSNSESTFEAAIAAACASATAIPDGLASVRALEDQTLLATQRSLAELRRLVDARASLVAGEVAFRSRRDLGYAGLAQREGFRTAQKLVQETTGSTAREASTLVAVGTMVHETMVGEALAEERAGEGHDAADPVTGELREDPVVHEPWLAAVGAAVATGGLTVEAARAIRSGLGEPSRDADGIGVEAEQLAAAAARLLDEAGDLNADRLFRLAQQLRDELDLAGVAVREQLLYDQRAFRRTKRANGLPRYVWEPDLETSAYLDDLFDNLLSPRRGGPRFIDPTERAWADSVTTDPRSDEQYLSDAFAGLLRLGVAADRVDRRNAQQPADGSGDQRPAIVGTRTPAVRVLVTEHALRTGVGIGHLEGKDVPISLDSVKRIICDSGILPIRFTETDDIVALGRQERLFTGRQRIALAARDGGCLWSGCDRPPSWTEAHHITPWRNGGRTDLCDGVLLCRHHHMLLHNNHWEIVRRGSTYWLIPPASIDPDQTPRQLASKSAAVRDLQQQRHLARREARGDPVEPDGAADPSIEERADDALAGAVRARG